MTLKASALPTEEQAPIRIMVVDDSAVVRGLISRALQNDARFNLVASASDGKMAIEVAERVQPEVILLDIEMPEMDGLTALPTLRNVAPHAKIMIVFAFNEKHAETAMQALKLGALDIMTKPSSQDAATMEDFFGTLRQKIRVLAGRSKSSPLAADSAAAIAESSASPTVVPLPTPEAEAVPAVTPSKQFVKPYAIAIASSTGGPQALLNLFENLRQTKLTVPVFITQHMPEGFTATFAQHLAKASGIPCFEAKDNQVVQSGAIYIAPGDYHMTIVKRLHEVVIKLNQEAPENYCRPSADPMLRSLVPIYGEHLMLIVLTGMGADALAGAREVVKAGGYVVAQDRASSVVWGMPKAVVEAKLVHAELPLAEIPELIARAVK